MSCRLFRIIAIFAVLLASMKLSFAAEDTTYLKRINPLDMKNIMLVKDIKPGMKGYGLTVFRGTKIEKFQVEVLGVLQQANMGKEQILVKMTGGPMTQRGAYLIHGMSGSPVYINGKLVGAFAYGEAFVKEPIGMLTPIQYMLDAWDPTLPSKPSSFFPFGTNNLSNPIALSGNSYNKVLIENSASGDEDQPMDSDTLLFRPLATQMTVSGMSPHILSWLGDQLRPLNIRPVAGPGTANDKSNMNIELQPGSGVGLSLVTGDMDVSAIGTVTYRRGNKILAFGHPMFITPSMNGMGAISAPMTTAYIFDVLPSVYSSSKLGAPVKQIGTVFQDRPWAIGGEIGKKPEMIPVTVHVNDQSSGRKREFHANVIKHPMLSGTFIVATAAEAVFELRGSPGDATATVKMEVSADEIGTITRENMYFDPMSIDMASMAELNQVMQMLQFNPLYPVGVKGVNIWVNIIPKHQTAKLERIFLKEAKYEPGDTVEIGAVLKPFKGERVTKTLKLKLPKNMPVGQMSLQVGGGGMAQGSILAQGGDGGLGAMIAGSAGIQPAPAIENLQQLVKKFQEREKNNELVAKVVLPRPVTSIAGEKLTGLPPSIAEAMKSPKATALGSERDEIKEVIPTDWVISGVQRLTFTVRKPDVNEKVSAARKATDPGTGAAPSSAPGGPPSPGDMDDEMADMAATTAKPEAFAAPAANAVPEKKSDAKAETPKQGETAKGDEDASANPDEAKKEAAPPADEKPVGRQPITWKQTSRAEFLGGKFDNIAATTGDLLTTASSIKPLCNLNESYVWCVLPDGKGNIYTGTGNQGIIYKIAADGSSSVVYDSPELEIHSLAIDSAGNLYAGTSPNGIIYKIDSAGKATKLFDADEKYIVALSQDSKGNIYAATGDKCKVYKIAPDGTSSIVMETSEAYALSLAVDKSDNVYVGTGSDGLIYKISTNGKTEVLYDAAEESVTALAVDSKDVLYAGTSPKGVIYKLAPGVTPKAIYDKAGQGIHSICIDKEYFYAVNSASVFKIMPDDTVCTLDNTHDLQFLSMAIGDGKVYLGTGNMGSIYTADTGNASIGTYESLVHDCGSTSGWGIINWTSNLPLGTSIALQTRTGDSAEPDSTWSGWSTPYSMPGMKVSSPAGRYIQYKVTLSGSDASACPELKDVSIVYLPKNQSPKVTITSPKGGEKWSKTKTIKWTGADPDKDTLVYELFYYNEGGKSWEPLNNKVKTTPAEKQEQPKKEESEIEETTICEPVANVVISPDPQQVMAEMAAELEKHPEIPQEIKDQIMAKAPSMIDEKMAQLEEMAKTPATMKIDETADDKASQNCYKQTSFAWDTSKFKDGIYLIKIVGSDKLSNPTDAMTSEAVTEPIVVVNKAPKILTLKKTVTVQADKSVRLEGIAWQRMVGITGVQYKVDSGDWTAAAASDGIFDTQLEGFVLTTEKQNKGDHTIEIKVIDQAGNSATTKVKAKVD